MDKPIMNKLLVNVPNADPIEVISYYECFKDYYPNCEMETKQWFMNNIKDDWVILDCGANIGYFTILFSRLAPHGKVHAFEPTTTSGMLLCNLVHNKVDNVIVLNNALGSEKGMRKDEIFRIWGQPPEKLLYPFTTIDEYTKHMSRVDLIKIDVDSFDLEVMMGAVKALDKFDPYVVVEVNDGALNKRGYNADHFLEFIRSLGYRTDTFLDKENLLLLPRNKIS